MSKKKIVVLSGAGISQESGILTFRDMGGLWEKYDITEVASPKAWERDPQLVLEFYNIRRRQLFEVSPNPAHYALAKLEQVFDIEIITQNVDDLHERAGSTKVLHLHGELKKARSTKEPSLIYTLPTWELNLGDTCELGSQLRPHIVWFGEAVPNMSEAVYIAKRADLFIVVGTSLLVYPAAGLINYVSHSIPKFYIDPNAETNDLMQNFKIYKEKAGVALPKLAEELIHIEKSSL